MTRSAARRVAAKHPSPPSNLGPFVDLGLESLAPPFGGSNVASTLRRVARRLCAAPWAGFEVRLGGGHHAIDLQQGFARDEADPSQCMAWVTGAATNALDREPWDRLQTFLAQWLDASSGLHEGVSDVGLEFDIAEGIGGLPIPSVFVALERDGTSTDSRAAVAKRTVEALWGCPPPRHMWNRIERIFRSCPAGALAGFLGVMLARDACALRVNAVRLPPEAIIPLLRMVSWPGDPERLRPLLSSLYRYVDRVTVCFDVSEDLSARMGLECIFDEQPDREPRWLPFLDYLCDQGWCTVAKRQAVLGWPGVNTPQNVHRPWPDDLVIGSLLGPVDRFTVINRWISHIKIEWAASGEASAKAYLGFRHRWHRSGASLPGRVSGGPPVARWATVRDIRSYYDAMHPYIVQHVGETYQAGLVGRPGEGDPYRANNLRLATEAGVQDGMLMLDAGCGAGGPAADIAARFPSVRIDGVTLSAVQAAFAADLARRRGCGDRVRIQVADMHRTPFPDAVFDLVVFFESGGYSADHGRLFAEVFRILKPGGTVYLKEPFLRRGPRTVAEEREISAVARLYGGYRLDTTDTMTTALRESGFTDVRVRDFSADCDLGAFFGAAMFRDADGAGGLTGFGAFHRYQFRYTENYFFGDVQARKPGTG